MTVGLWIFTKYADIMAHFPDGTRLERGECISETPNNHHMHYAVAHHPQHGRQGRRPFVHHSLTGTPAVNIRETEEAYLIDLVAPGREKSLFALSIKDDILRIDVKSPEQELPGEYRQREFFLQNAHRDFRLPKNVDENAIQAVYEHGVLTVTLLKRPESQPRVIDIQ